MGTINVRPITVTANAQARAYGDANPTLTYTVGGEGLVNNDTLSGSLASSATIASKVDCTNITQGTLANTNYVITSYTAAILTVSKATLDVTPSGSKDLRV